MIRYHLPLLIIITSFVFSGCNSGSSSSSGGQSEMDRMAQQLEQESAAKQQATEQADAAQQAAAPAAPPAVEEPARIGDSDQNREETSNPLLAAAHAYVFAENRATIWQHQSAIKNFHAEHGFYPKSHEEYIKKIVDTELVILPPPDEGFEYWYRPDDPMNIWLRPAGSGESSDEQP